MASLSRQGCSVSCGFPGPLSWIIFIISSCSYGASSPQQGSVGRACVTPSGRCYGTSYTWSPSSGLSCTTCPNPSVSPDETTTYTVITTDSVGCVASDQITIYVDYEYVIYIPNIFSPNGDGKNDILYVRGKGIKTLYFAIYDRWGEKVFETTDLNNGWDGTFKGKPLNKAVFVYYVKATFVDNSEVEQKGDITLIR